MNVKDLFDELIMTSDPITANKARDIEILIEKYIAELEAQVPKVVTPDKTEGGPTKLCRGRCECGILLVGWEKYCPKCGGKPNWEEA